MHDIKQIISFYSMIIEQHVTIISYQVNASENLSERDSRGGPVIKTLCFHCRGQEFNP